MAGWKNMSAAMMLRYSFDLGKEADCIEKAVEKVLLDGYRTTDIMEADRNDTPLSCEEMTEKILEALGGNA